MKLKEGVSIAGLTVQALLGIVIAKTIYAKYGDEFVITSGADGEHMEGSLHYVGQAFDLRSPAASTRNNISKEMADALGADYDVVPEETHIHIEYQPKDGA